MAPVINEAFKRKFKCILINHRAGSNTPLTSPMLYCAKSSWDTREALNYIHKQYPDKKIYAIGISLGANILSHYLGEEGDNCLLTKACCVSCPMVMTECA
jgi:predicted alpha/beta-fold hydrolase